MKTASYICGFLGLASILNQQWLQATALFTAACNAILLHIADSLPKSPTS